MKSRVDLLLLATLLSAFVAWCGSPSAWAGDAAAGAPISTGGVSHRSPSGLRPPGAEPNDGGPSSVIFPEQTLPLRFSHKRHVKELGVACTSCHSAAKTSKHAADSLLAPATSCDGCHGSDHTTPAAVTADETRALAQCSFCHTGYDPSRPNVVPRVLLPQPNLRFSHQRHVIGEQIPCARCHGRVEELLLATRDQLPRMKGCITCHALGPGQPASSAPAQGARSPTSHKRPTPSGACTTCHLSEASGLLKTTFPSGKLLPPPWLRDSGHGADFIERHKFVAGNDSRFCANCHQERFCVGCHDGSVRPRTIHPNDFISQHPIAARKNGTSCTSCHQQQSFCLSCHQRSGVAMSGPIANFSSRGRFHPPKSIWTDSPGGTRSPAHHAWEAERNLNACVSCHQERDCALCHATRSVGGRGSSLAGAGPGVSPHPAGFAGRCRQALRQNARPCLTCHAPSDPELLKCR